MTTKTLSDAVKKLLPHAEAEQESLYQMAKQNPDEYKPVTGLPPCRLHAYETLRKCDARERHSARQLPPDPDNMNADRAEWAAAALRHFQCTTGTDYEDALGDLLCDLMHWCDRNNFDFELASTSAWPLRSRNRVCPFDGLNRAGFTDCPFSINKSRTGETL